MEERVEQTPVEETPTVEETPGGAETPTTPPPRKKKPSQTAALTAEVAALKAQLAEANDKYLRMLAEYDNFRRRSVKEKQGVWSDAVAQTLKDLLPIADNLDRAAHATGDAEAIRQGLDMTLKAMTEMFARLGVEVYGKVGEPFDPTYHNAVMHIDDEAFGENVIAEVFQVGYRIGEKVIRFAMVKVAN